MQKTPTIQTFNLKEIDLNLSINKVLKFAEKKIIRQEIGKSITIIISDLGIKTIPDIYAQKRIIYYILTYYQDFSIEEIKVAFEMAIVGKLDVETEHFQSFDVKYISTILNSFRKFRNEKIFLKQAKENQKQSQKSEELSKNEQEELQAEYLKRLVESYEIYKKTGIINILIHWIAYNQLLEIQVLEISENYWTELMQRAEIAYKNELQRSKKQEHKEILKHFETAKYVYPFELSRIRNIAKKLAILDFFKNLKQNNENLSEIFIKTGSYE